MFLMLANAKDTLSGTADCYYIHTHTYATLINKLLKETACSQDWLCYE